MNQHDGKAKKPNKHANVDPEEFEEQILEDSYEHLERGGHEHGHDWDDWAKEDRALDAKGKKKKKGFNRPKEEEV